MLRLLAHAIQPEPIGGDDVRHDADGFDGWRVGTLQGLQRLLIRPGIVVERVAETWQKISDDGNLLSQFTFPSPRPSPGGRGC